MENVQTKATKMLSDMANAMVKKDTYEWPPYCGLFAYQPVRPQHRAQNLEKDQNEEV